MFNLAIENNKLLHDQKPAIRLLHEDNVRTGFFERDQFEDVRDALPEGLRGIVTLAYYTGWRVESEVQTLTWAQVDRDAQVIRLEAGTTKNDEPRSLPYGMLVEVIEGAWAKHKELASEGKLSPYVFNRRGEEIKSLRGAWKAACKEAGCPMMLPHDFRRTAVRNLVRAGVPDTVAMSITGHKTRSVFDRYNIVDERDKANALGMLSTSATRAKQGQTAELARVVEMR